MLASMCKQMFLHITLVTECSFTRIAGIWALASMCKLVSLHVRILTICFLTNHRHTDAGQYV